MKKVIALIGMSVSLTAFADSKCQTEAGRKALAAEYVASGGVVPVCGSQCSTDYILTQVCTLDSTANCFTSEGRELKIKEYVSAGNLVPSCGPQCAKDFILFQVCKIQE